MLPKVDACLQAVRAGVPKAHIVDGRVSHSILLEIYTDAGIGTQITLE
jgi:acetylglutamate kinase